MKSQIHLGPVKIDPVEYAIQGNAVLGIRDSGKSYTATYMAERLMDAKIPFTAFDPIGVWRWLRVPGKGPGYPVVAPGRRKPGPTSPNGSSGPSDLQIAPAHQRILDALAEFEAIGFPFVSRTQLGFWVGLRANTGNFGNYLGALRSAGLIDYPSAGQVALTENGRAQAAHVDVPPETAELQRRVREKLSPALWRILEQAIAVYPSALTREEIGEAVGLRANTGNFGNYLGSLRSLGLIDYPAPGQVSAQPVLFIDA